MIEAIVNLAHNLNLRVIAEGVETQEQLQFLRNSGCDLAQGFFVPSGVGRPERYRSAGGARCAFPELSGRSTRARLTPCADQVQ